jgi:DNA-directed RNA polymerase specialized sigma24 family protein
MQGLVNFINTEKWLKFIDKEATRVFAHSGYPIDDAVAEVRVCLLEKFGHAAGVAANNEGLLKTAARQIVIDQFRKAFGRESMPPWVKALGKWAEQVWRLYCKRRLSVSAICREHGGTHEDQEVQGLVAALATDDGCAKEKNKNSYHSPGQREQSMTELDEDGGAGQSDLADTTASEGEQESMAAEYLQLVRAITGWRSSSSEAEQRVAAHIQQLGTTLSEEMALSDDERILLRMHFQEDKTVAQIARELERPRQKVERPIKRVCARIHDCLVHRGIELGDLIGH